MDLLFKLRRRKCLTQDQLARESQVAIRTIQRIESGKTVPKPDTARSLAAVLGVDPIAIIEGAGLIPRVNAVLPKLCDDRFVDICDRDIAGMPDDIVEAIIEYRTSRLACQESNNRVEAANRRLQRATDACRATDWRTRPNGALEELRLSNEEANAAMSAVMSSTRRLGEATSQLQTANLGLYFS